jgi:hypothetical protein
MSQEKITIRFSSVRYSSLLAAFNVAERGFCKPDKRGNNVYTGFLYHDIYVAEAGCDSKVPVEGT